MVVDEHNDWWVFFDDENPLRVRIAQRYDAPALSTLGDWIAYRWRAKVVAPASPSLAKDRTLGPPFGRG